MSHSPDECLWIKGSSGERDHVSIPSFGLKKGPSKPKRVFKPKILLIVRQQTTREAPKQNTKVNKEEENAAESLLLREDVLDDSELILNSVSEEKASTLRKQDRDKKCCTSHASDFYQQIKPEHHKMRSVLEDLQIDMIKDIPLDYMHLV
ncbi:hypothetical protein DAPPUDRAFT_333530 [Daphnia pulex]|uniref:Uncharacterized protein n=1 Tax=Daphnia pulex TaxID=6669 RepID=E9HT36_DAPPU|nr:hypothetical protein DAPPUDRAFT_333530 [Daphnia pulex]|eukprot:EFX65074.1 hypothetical protein DAPPUDRAFT_333530 [Daphnia pulex]